MGYHRAGFDVVGVDIKPQPHYPFEFIRADALEVLAELAAGAEWFTHGAADVPTTSVIACDAIHASPPCQGYSKLAAMHPGQKHPLLLGVVRELLAATGLPFVIENVETAPMLREPGLYGLHGLMACGTSFGLGARNMDLRRHRLFESNLILSSLPCRHTRPTIGVYGHGGHSGKRRMAYRKEAAEALGIDWMSRDEMCQAIPPAYTEFIGRQLLAAL